MMKKGAVNGNGNKDLSPLGHVKEKDLRSFAAHPHPYGTVKWTDDGDAVGFNNWPFICPDPKDPQLRQLYLT